MRVEALIELLAALGTNESFFGVKYGPALAPMTRIEPPDNGPALPTFLVVLGYAVLALKTTEVGNTAAVAP